MDEKAAEIDRQRAAEFEKKQKEVLMKQQEMQKAKGKLVLELIFHKLCGITLTIHTFGKFINN